MASLERVKAEIAEIASRPKAVRFEEIERIVRQLGQLGYEIGARPATHGTLFRVGKNPPFMVSNHHPGDSHILSVYVRVFLEAMITIGLLEED